MLKITTEKGALDDVSAFFLGIPVTQDKNSIISNKTCITSGEQKSCPKPFSLDETNTIFFQKKKQQSQTL